MALYVITVPDPPAGQDWRYTVPGQYIEHITGITATLTAGNGAPPFFADASGQGNDTTAIFPTGWSFGVPGILAGDDAVAGAGGAQLCEGPVTAGFLSDDFTLAGWCDVPTAGPYQNILVEMTGPNGTDLVFAVFYQFGQLFISLQLRVGVAPGVLAGVSTPVSAPVTFGPHYVAVAFDSLSNVAHFYLDGVAVASLGIGPPTEDPDTFQIGGLINGTQGDITIDDYAWWRQVLAPADIAAGYAAGLTDEATYAAFVAGFIVRGYYKLDEFVAGTGRTVNLEITNGTAQLLVLPSDFPAVSTPGPYAYSWQPNLNSSSQTPNGKVTTVAVPDLILPAGYTVGTLTSDLAGGDQWSDITIWWDGAYMDALDPLNAYVFPGGIRLVYQQEKP